MKSNNEIVQELGFELLSEDQIIKEGLEFAGEVCFSGEYGQQVCDKETEDGGQPVNGLLYEFRRNGALAYYAYYCEGFPHGESVRFYDNGRIKSFCVMDHGTIGGQYTEWYENGSIKEKKCCKFGITLWRKEFDLEGNIFQEMIEPNETGKKLLAKYTEWYEKDDSGNTATN